MELRAELLPPREPINELAAQVERAFDLSDRDGPAAATEWFTANTGIEVSPDDLHGWSASISSDQAARLLKLPPRHELKRLGATRAELIEIARRWLPDSPEYDAVNEAWWTAIFDANVPRPAASNAAFYPPDGMDEDDVSPEWLVDHALAYRAIEL